MTSRFFHLSVSTVHALGCLFCVWLLTGCTPAGFQMTGAENLEPHVPVQTEAPVESMKSFEFTHQDPPAPVPEPAGQTLTLSVEQAVMLALAHNHDLKTRQLGPVIAGAFEQMEKGRYDPEVFAQIDVTQEPINKTIPVIWPWPPLSASANPFPWAPHSGWRRALSRTVLPDHGHGYGQARITLSVTQALLQGAGPAGGLVTIRQGELETRASSHELTAYVQALVAETEIAYWQYVLACQEHAIVERSLAVSKRQQTDVQHQIEVGSLPRNELAAVQSEVARRKQALIDSANQVETFRLALLHLIDPGMAGYLDQNVLSVSDPVIDPDPVDDIKDRTELAVKLRPDLAEARLRLQQHRLETIVTHNGLLPRLDFFMDLGIAGFSRRSSEALQTLDNGDLELFAGVSLSRFVGNRPARARHQAALATRQQAMKALENLGRTIDLDVRLAANELERARQQIHASRITRRSEEQTVQAEIERFMGGGRDGPAGGPGSAGPADQPDRGVRPPSTTALP